MKALRATLAALCCALLSACPSGDSPLTEAAPEANVRNATAALKTHKASCYYVPLPGEFRVFCPGPKNDRDGCASLAAAPQARFDSADRDARTFSGRALTPGERRAVPSACAAFDLPALPNASHGFSYTIADNRYVIFSYLPFGNGEIP